MQAGTSPPPRVFFARKNFGWQAAAYIAGGSLLICFGLLSLVIDLMTTSSRGNSHVANIMGGIMTAAIFSIGYGVFLLRTPLRVALDEQGVSIEGRISRRRIGWSQIAGLSRDKSRALFGGQTHDVLTLRDEKDAVLAKIQDVFMDFPSLVLEIELRSAAARGAATYNRDADLQRKVQQQKRGSKRAAVLCSLMVLIGLTIGIGGGYVYVHQRKFASEGVTIDAKIVQQHYKSVTPYVEYSFADETGRTFTREAMIDKETHDELAGASTVKVQYIRSQPDWSRLVKGEPEHNMLWLMLGGSLFALLFGAFLVMMSLGYSDLTIKDGKIRLKRFGEVDDAFEAPAKPQAAGVPLPRPVSFSQIAELPVEKNRTPSGIMAIAVLNIVLGSIGILFNAARLIFLVMFGGKVMHIAGRVMVIDPPHWLLAWCAVDLVLAALLVTSAFGLIWLKSWGRRLSLPVAALQIASTIGAVVVSIHSTLQQPESPELHTRSAEMAGAFGGVIVQLLTAVYPLIVLIVLSRRSAADTFRAKV